MASAVTALDIKRCRRTSIDTTRYPMSALIVPLLYPDLAGLRNFHTSFQNNYRLADHPEGGQTTQYKRVSVLIRRTTSLPGNGRRNIGQ
jgi:hypothetical protein